MDLGYKWKYEGACGVDEDMVRARARYKRRIGVADPTYVK